MHLESQNLQYCHIWNGSCRVYWLCGLHTHTLTTHTEERKRKQKSTTDNCKKRNKPSYETMYEFKYGQTNNSLKQNYQIQRKENTTSWSTFSYCYSKYLASYFKIPQEWLNLTRKRIPNQPTFKGSVTQYVVPFSFFLSFCITWLTDSPW